MLLPPQAQALLVVYVDDFKLAGPNENMTEGWAQLRKYLGIEDEVEVGAEGTSYLGCRQARYPKRLPHGGMATVMEWDMDKFLDSCLDKYKELAQVKDVRPAPTPFLTEDHAMAPARAAGKGPCVECPWRCHTFPLGIMRLWRLLRRLNRRKRPRGPAGNWPRSRATRPI